MRSELLNEMIILSPRVHAHHGQAIWIKKSDLKLWNPLPPIIFAARLCTRSVVNESEKIILLKLSYLTLGQLSSISWSRSHEKNNFISPGSKLDPVLKESLGIKKKHVFFHVFFLCTASRPLPDGVCSNCLVYR